MFYYPIVSYRTFSCPVQSCHPLISTPPTHGRPLTLKRAPAPEVCAGAFDLQLRVAAQRSVRTFERCPPEAPARTTTPKPCLRLRAWHLHRLDALGCWTRLPEPLDHHASLLQPARPPPPPAPFPASPGRSALCLCLCFAKTSCCAAVGTCVVEI